MNILKRSASSIKTASMAFSGLISAAKTKKHWTESAVLKTKNSFSFIIQEGKKSGKKKQIATSVQLIRPSIR